MCALCCVQSWERGEGLRLTRPLLPNSPLSQNIAALRSAGRPLSPFLRVCAKAIASRAYGYTRTPSASGKFHISLHCWVAGDVQRTTRTPCVNVMQSSLYLLPYIDTIPTSSYLPITRRKLNFFITYCETRLMQLQSAENLSIIYRLYIK